MIVVRSPSGKFKLSWIKGEWRDAAGHRWAFDAKTGVFSNPRHGEARLDEWRAERPLDDDARTP